MYVVFANALLYIMHSCVIWVIINSRDWPGIIWLTQNTFYAIIVEQYFSVALNALVLLK